MTYPAEDLTEVSLPAYAEPYPTTGPLAWSQEEMRSELVPYHHRRARWTIPVTATVIATVALAWCGIALQRQPTGTPRTAMPSTAPPAIAPTPSAKPPDPHPAPQYPWVAVAVWDKVQQDGDRSINVGYGTSQDLAVDAAQKLCHRSGHANCINEAAAADACVGLAADDHGGLASAIGATSDDAITMAKMHLPSATKSRAFCSWDGNGLPSTLTPTPSAPPPPTAAPPINVPAPKVNNDIRFIAILTRIFNGAEPPDPQLAIQSAHVICAHLREGSTTPEQAAIDTMNADPGISFETAQLTVEAAIDVYCPQFS